MSEITKLEELLAKGRMTRRQFLNRVSMLGLAGAVSPALWSSIAHAATPKKGGSYRIGVTGGSAAETLDPDRRRAMYWELQEIVRDDGGTIIPMYAQYVFAKRDTLAHGPLAANRGVDGWKSMERWWFKS